MLYSIVISLITNGALTKPTSYAAVGGVSLNVQKFKEQLDDKVVLSSSNLNTSDTALDYVSNQQMVSLRSQAQKSLYSTQQGMVHNEQKFTAQSKEDLLALQKAMAAKAEQKSEALQEGASQEKQAETRSAAEHTTEVRSQKSHTQENIDQKVALQNLQQDKAAHEYAVQKSLERVENIKVDNQDSQQRQEEQKAILQDAQQKQQGDDAFINHSLDQKQEEILTFGMSSQQVEFRQQSSETGPAPVAKAA